MFVSMKWSISTSISSSSVSSGWRPAPIVLPRGRQEGSLPITTGGTRAAGTIISTTTLRAATIDSPAPRRGIARPDVAVIRRANDVIRPVIGSWTSSTISRIRRAMGKMLISVTRTLNFALWGPISRVVAIIVVRRIRRFIGLEDFASLLFRSVILSLFIRTTFLTTIIERLVGAQSLFRNSLSGNQRLVMIKKTQLYTDYKLP